MDVLSGEELRRLSYLELKQYAKNQGIKKSYKKLKTEKLIAAILSAREKADGTLESFTCDESIDITFDQSQVPLDIVDKENTPSRRKSRRFTDVLSVESTPQQKQVLLDTGYNGDTSSTQKSSRLTEVLSVENTPQENQSWSEDSEIVLKTPKSSLRRTGTFCIETPVTLPENQPKLDESARVSAAKTQFNKRRATVSISDVPRKNPVTPDAKGKLAISEDKTCVVSACQPVVTPSKSLRKSILRHDNKSYSGKKNSSSKNSGELKSNGNKVNFVTPDRTFLRRSSPISETPLRSVKDRPKTPVATKDSAKRKRACSPFPEKSPKMIKTINGYATPKSLNGAKSDKALQTETPVAKSAEKKPFAVATRLHSARKELTTPLMSEKKNRGSEKRKVRTPHFKEIHQKAFEKMETLDEYHERKQNRIHTLTRSQQKSRTALSTAQRSSTKRSVQKKKQNSSEKTSQQQPESAKPSRIPQPFRGIPFIPVVKSIRKINTNFATQAQSQSLINSSSKMTNIGENLGRKCQRTLFTSGPVSTVFQFGKDTENPSTATDENKERPRRKFDLKASLAKKLPYKPHRGVVRPLADSNTSEVNPYVNSIKQKKREQSREVLKGVRKNRRFELQMSRRGLA